MSLPLPRCAALIRLHICSLYCPARAPTLESLSAPRLSLPVPAVSNSTQPFGSIYVLLEISHGLANSGIPQDLNPPDPTSHGYPFPIHFTPSLFQVCVTPPRGTHPQMLRGPHVLQPLRQHYCGSAAAGEGGRWRGPAGGFWLLECAM